MKTKHKRQILMCVIEKLTPLELIELRIRSYSNKQEPIFQTTFYTTSNLYTFSNDFVILSTSLARHMFRPASDHLHKGKQTVYYADDMLNNYMYI